MMAGLLDVEQDEGVWTIVLNRPEKRNALSSELVDQLLDLVNLGATEHVRVLVFRGAGKNFSAGFDFSDVSEQSEGDLVLRFVRIQMLLQAVASSPCLTVAFAHGKNFGAGVDLIAACRERYAAADASFRMPGLKFGLVLGTRRFGDLVGRERAAQIQQEAATFDANRALEMGFVHQVVEPASWDVHVDAARTRASSLNDGVRMSLYRVLDSQQPDVDMATLVRSAAQKGLKERVARYLRTAGGTVGNDRG